MRDDGIEPSEITVRPGSTVRFKNKSSQPLLLHGVVEDRPVLSFDRKIATNSSTPFSMSDPGVLMFWRDSDTATTGVVNFAGTLDLAADSLIGVSTRPEICEGEPVSLIGFVRCAGDVSCTNLVMTIYDGLPESGGSEIVKQRVTYSGNGSLTPLTFTFTNGMTAGVRDFYLVADTDNAIAEINETNNTIALRLTVLADQDTNGVPDTWQLQYFKVIGSMTEYSDYDNDGARDYDEYLAGTDPTNRASSLNMSGLDGSTIGGGLAIHWSSVTGKEYHLDCSTNLTQGFEWSVSNLLATPPVNTYTDKTATANGPYFYRVRLKQ